MSESVQMRDREIKLLNEEQARLLDQVRLKVHYFNNQVSGLKSALQESQSREEGLIAQAAHYKDSLHECKEIILRNNYRMIYDQEYEAINDSLRMSNA